jgi:hypothetical protein
VHLLLAWVFGVSTGIAAGIALPELRSGDSGAYGRPVLTRDHPTAI